MKPTLVITLLGGLATGTALAWFRPFDAAPTVQAKTTNQNLWARPSQAGSGKGGTMLLSDSWKQAVGRHAGFSQRLALMALVMRASPEEMPGLLAQSKDNTFARELLIMRWVEIDAAGAGEWIAPSLKDPGTPGLEATYQDVSRVLTAWAKQDPEAAMAKVKELSSGYQSIQFENQIIASVLTVDMERGIKFASAAKSRNPMYGYMEIDHAWVAKDPAKAARLLSELPEGDFRNQALTRTIGELGKKDLAAGIALLTKFPSLATSSQRWGYQGTDSRSGFLEKWAKEDMPAMIGFLNDQAQGETRTAMKEAIAKSIGEGDPKVAFAWAADNLSGQRRNNVVNTLITKLAKENPAEALDYITSLPTGSAMQNAINAFTSATTKEDPLIGLARAKALPEGDARTRLVGNSYTAWYGKDAEAALTELARQPADSLPPGMWRNIGYASAKLDDGLKQLSQIPQDKAPEFIQGIFNRYNNYNEDPAAGAKSIELLKDPAHRSAAIETVVGGSWLYQDPDGAVAWAAKLPSAEERKQVFTLLDSRLKGRYQDDARAKLLAPLK